MLLLWFGVMGGQVPGVSGRWPPRAAFGGRGQGLGGAAAPPRDRKKNLPVIAHFLVATAALRHLKPVMTLRIIPPQFQMPQGPSGHQESPNDWEKKFYLSRNFSKSILRGGRAG